MQAVVFWFSDQRSDRLAIVAEHRFGRTGSLMTADAVGMSVVVGKELLDIGQLDRTKSTADQFTHAIQSRERIAQAVLPVRIAGVSAAKKMIRVNQKAGTVIGQHERAVARQFDIGNRPRVRSTRGC